MTSANLTKRLLTVVVRTAAAPDDERAAALSAVVPTVEVRLTSPDLSGGQGTPGPVGPVGCVLLPVAAAKPRTATATTAKRAAPADGAGHEDDGPVGRSTCEITTRPTIVATVLDVLAVAEPYGGQDTVAIPTADGTCALVACGRPSPVAPLVAGHASGPAGQASADAAGRSVGKQATASPRRMEDTSASLPSRRRLAADGPRTRSPPAPVAALQEGSALRA